ncbi:MAG: iron-sulfur cluster assembly scaffold protein [Pseudomonadota bacterium]
MSTLYTPEMLALAIELALYPLDERFSRQASARSKVCGSTLAIGFDLNAEGAVSRIGLKVSACAVGQGSAAILAQGVQGSSAQQLSDTLDAIRAWLAGEGEMPDWPGFQTLAPARERTGRHGALLLPWEAAVKALSAVDCAGDLSSRSASR